MSQSGGGTHKPFDLSTRQLVEHDPLAWLHFVGLPGKQVTLEDANLATVEAEADRFLHVTDPDHPEAEYLAHLELQASHDAVLPRRLLYYNVVGYHKHDLPVRSVVILLRPQAERARLSGRLQYPGLVFDYGVVRVWERSAEELLSAPLALLPLAPLTQVAQDALPGVVQRMKQRIESEAELSSHGMLWTTTLLLMGLKYDPAFSRQLLQGVREMRESSTYQAILQEGREEGLAEGARRLLLVMGTKRFGIPDETTLARLNAILSEPELEQLATRLLEVESWAELLES